jgi:transposase
MTKSKRNKIIYARFQEGYIQKIGSFYSLSQSAVSLIIVNIRKGVAELKEETRGAATSRFSVLDLENIIEKLKVLPWEKGFNYWNKWSVKSLIKEEFGVDYHQNYIWDIMDKIGFSSQIPQEKDCRQSSEEISDFKKTKIPEIKNRGRKKTSRLPR